MGLQDDRSLSRDTVVRLRTQDRRDRFAAAALTGILASNPPKGSKEAMALAAWMMADAMLQEDQDLCPA